MRKFDAILYFFSIICCFIGFIIYNYGVSNDRDLLLAALTIGVGVAGLLASYI